MYAIFGELFAAIPAALLVQLVILMTSRHLGAAIARMVSHHNNDLPRLPFPRAALHYGLLTAIYLLMLTLSLFFAFNFYYHKFSARSQDQLVAEGQPNLYAGAILPRLRQLVADQHTKRVKNFADQDAAVFFMAMSDLRRRAGDPAVQEKVRKAAADLQIAQYNERKRLIEELSQQRKIRADELSKLEARYEPPRATAETADKIKKLEGDVEKLKVALDEESNGNAKLGASGLAAALVKDPSCKHNRPSGPGACYNALNAEREKALSELKRLRAKTEEAAEATKNLDARKEQLKTAIAKLNEQLAHTQPLSDPKLTSGGGATIENFGQKMDDSMDALRKEPLSTNLNAVTRICQNLTEALADEDGQPPTHETSSVKPRRPPSTTAR